MFPESFTFSIADWVNDWVDKLVTNYGDVFRHISDTLLWAIVKLEGLLRVAHGGCCWPSSASSPGTPPVKSRPRP
jgi:ABC-type proline/glycine betaine transport system permease subunit